MSPWQLPAPKADAQARQATPHTFSLTPDNNMSSKTTRSAPADSTAASASTMCSSITTPFLHVCRTTPCTPNARTRCSFTSRHVPPITSPSTTAAAGKARQASTMATASASNTTTPAFMTGNSTCRVCMAATASSTCISWSTTRSMSNSSITNAAAATYGTDRRIPPQAYTSSRSSPSEAATAW